LNAEQIGLWAGFVFTLMIFSYILGDNILYRLAVYVFAGLAAGYITLVTVEGVLLPWLRGTLLSPDAVGVGGQILGIVPFVLGLLLLLKGSPRLGPLGNIAIAFIVAVGTAVALVGAITGTLLPLAAATGSGVRIDLVNGFLIFIGISSTLVYFQYLARRQPGGEVRRGLVVRAIGALGQGVVVVTLGAIYAGAILTSLTIFSERIGFILARITGG
jgi:hypothetical protein